MHKETERENSTGTAGTPRNTREQHAEGTDLQPDEAADVMETRQEAERIKDARDDTQHEDLISLDVPD